MNNSKNNYFFKNKFYIFLMIFNNISSNLNLSRKIIDSRELNIVFLNLK